MSAVQVFVYDLSQGMARMMSLAWTGTFFEAIWHTSVVVHGQEVYFGQGIQRATPGMTHLGPPMKTINMSSTAKSQQEWQAWLDEQGRTKFRTEDCKCLCLGSDASCL